MKKLLRSKKVIFMILYLIGITACSFTSPLKEINRVAPASDIDGAEGVQIKFLGNTTLHISDGTTNLLVDGFLSRPGYLRTVFLPMKSRPKIITEHLTKSELENLDAVFVTHSHYDHALDAPAISNLCDKCKVYGSESYRFLHNVLGGKKLFGSLRVVPKDGAEFELDKFVVRFYQSSHVEVDPNKKPFVHRLLKPMQGDVNKSIMSPLRRKDFKTGDVFGLHIHHKEHGDIVVATTAGARENQLKNRKADIVFLSVGFLHEATDADQELYWEETVEETDPHTIVPIHWDNFARNLSKKLKPSPMIISDTGKAMHFLQQKSCDRGIDFLIMGYNETITLHNHQIQ